MNSNNIKIKYAPDDFIVTELTDFQTTKASSGRYALYGLEKMGLETAEVATIISRMWDIRKEDIGYGRYVSFYNYLTRARYAGTIARSRPLRQTHALRETHALSDLRILLVPK